MKTIKVRILLNSLHSYSVLLAALLLGNQVSVIFILPGTPSASFQNGVKDNGQEKKWVCAI